MGLHNAEEMTTWEIGIATMLNRPTLYCGVPATLDIGSYVMSDMVYSAVYVGMYIIILITI